MPRTRAHLATLIARAAVDADGARSLHERTGGNPLFVGETVRAFLEDGTMELRDGRVALVDPSSTRVPITLRAVLGARIDALDPDCREAVGVASVIGIRFHEEHLASLLDESLRPGVLGRLAQEAIIQPLDEGEWRFAHPLIHDAAYAGLLASHRRVLHARLADQLEERDGPPVIEQLAAHRAAAGDAEPGRARSCARPPSAPRRWAPRWRPPRCGDGPPTWSSRRIPPAPRPIGARRPRRWPPRTRSRRMAVERG